MLSETESEKLKQNHSSESVAEKLEPKSMPCDARTTDPSVNQSNSNQGPSNNMLFGGQYNKTYPGTVPANTAGLRQFASSQNTGNTTQILEFLMQSLHIKQKEYKHLKDYCLQLELKIRMDGYEKTVLPTNSKEPIVRAKSEPENHHKRQKSDIRKTSAPEIFVFPDTRLRTDKTVTDRYNQQKENLRKNVSSGMTGASPVSESPVSADGLHSSAEEHEQSSDKDDCEFQGLRDSFQEPPGVSAQYFNNVINELMKTKTYLHNLQMKQKANGDGAASEKEMDKMRNEIQQLRLTNQELKRDLDEKEAVIVKLTPEPVPVKDDSFELSTESDPELTEQSKTDSNPSSQGSAEAEIQRLSEEVEELTKQNQVLKEEKDQLQNILMQDNYDINRELIQLNEAYDRLKANGKILSTCLQEEKARSRNSDEKLRIKTEEAQKMSIQLGSLRQKYEELRQEKNALEKSRSLEEPPSMRFSSPRSRTVSSETNRSGGSNRSGELPRYLSNRSTGTHSPYSSRSGNLDSYNIRPENWPPRPSQNDLSIGENEPKMLNLPQFGGASSSAKYECPRCLRKFQVENSYFIHMQSCLD